MFGRRRACTVISMSETVLPRVPTPLFVGDVDGGEVTGGFVLPTGTVTFLMTHIEGSTRAWQRRPGALTEAVPRHYDILDEAISSHRGVRPVEQGEGDSVVAAFSRASDAVQAAVAAQRLLAAEQWPDGVALKVRMALHTGRRSSAMRGITSVSRSSVAPVCARVGTAARCCCRTSPPRWSPTGWARA